MAPPNDRVDQLDARLRQLEGWAIDHARELREVERDLQEHLDKYEPIIDAMVERDRIGEALTEAAKTTRQVQREAHTLHLSWTQLAFAGIVSGCAIAGLVVTVLR